GASKRRVDLRFALSRGRLTIEPSLRGWEPLPAANGGRHVDAAPCGVPWRLPQLVEIGEEGVDEPLDLSVGVGAGRPIEADEDGAGRNSLNLRALGDQARVNVARHACGKIGLLEWRRVGDLQELEADIPLHRGECWNRHRAEADGSMELSVTHQ